MRLTLGIATMALATVTGLYQSPADSQRLNTPQWQEVNQLCGILKFDAPLKKTITVNGKTEVRLYANFVKGAEVALYRGTAVDKTCCTETTPAGHAQSTKLGRFEFSGFQSGWYWLRVKKDDFSTTIPLHVTSDFNEKSCHSPSVGRVFTVDVQPPKVETQIY